MNTDKKRRSRRSRYHHGDLRTALIEAGEALLAERGVEGFSLREAARRAGVSPGAPAHHFGDARGLLTAIAARGFQGLTAALAAADRAAPRRRAERVRSQGVAYVTFALKNPASFDLMWRKALLDVGDAELRTAGRAAFNVLRRAVEGERAIAEGASRPVSHTVIAAWSVVHGYARLALDGAFDPWAPGQLEGALRCLRI